MTIKLCSFIIRWAEGTVPYGTGDTAIVTAGYYGKAISKSRSTIDHPAAVNIYPIRYGHHRVLWWGTARHSYGPP